MLREQYRRLLGSSIATVSAIELLATVFRSLGRHRIAHTNTVQAALQPLTGDTADHDSYILHRPPSTSAPCTARNDGPFPRAQPTVGMSAHDQRGHIRSTATHGSARGERREAATSEVTAELGIARQSADYHSATFARRGASNQRKLVHH